MNTTYRRHFREGLPLPLAQLYSRAYNDKEVRSRHNNTYYLFEALVRLTASVLIVAYRDELARGAPASPRLSSLLRCLALPSAGQWVELLREMARYFGTRTDASSHPVGHIWHQLNVEYSREAKPAIVELYNEIVNGVDGQHGSYSSCSILKLIHALVSYRNQVFGHGAERWLHFYEERMGPRLLPALNEVLADGVLDCLGPNGSMLVFVSEVRLASEGWYEVSMRELVGMASERLDPVEVKAEDLSDVRPHVIGVLWPSRAVPLALEPLLLFREREIGEEILFLNSHKDGEKVEYLSYTAGYTTREPDTGSAMADLLATLTGEAFNEDQVDEEAHKLAIEEVEDLESVPEEPPIGTARMGDYEILAEVGRGGMGVVYLARQISLGRIVALKMLPNEVQGDEAARARFRRDIRALAKSDHPNIVKLLDADVTSNGCLYYTMEYVPGSNLEQVWQELARANAVSPTADLTKSALTRAVWIAAQRQRKELTLRHNSRSAHWGPATEESVRNCQSQLPLPDLPEMPDVDEIPGGYVRRICELIRDAARALQAAHDNGIVHRDVSPANLLITPDSSRLVLMDFGLAKGQTVSASLSDSGSFVGKLRYAAPEQLATAVFEVGPPADVRGLGVTLWELLTRRRLFSESEDERQLASKITLEDVPRLREVDPSLDRDLEAIVARATERDTNRRIQSAEQLASYLDLYLNGQPLPIRPPSRLEQGWRKVRDRSVVGVSVAVLAFAIVGTVLGYAFLSSGESEMEIAYDEARDLWKERTSSKINTATERFVGMTNAWPEFVKAYTGLADCYILLGYLGDLHPINAYEKAGDLAEKALNLNSDSARACTSQAYVKFAYEWKWEEADKLFRRAIDLDGSYATAHHWYSWYLSAMGRHKEAIQEAEEAVSINRSSTILTVDLGWCYYFARNWSKAKETYEDILGPGIYNSSHFPLAHVGLGMTLLEIGDKETGLEELRAASERTNDTDYFIKARLGYALAKNGQTNEAREILKELREKYDDGDEDTYLPPTYLAIVNVGLDEPEKAIDWLEKAAENRSEYVTTLNVHPVFDPLRDEPRFQRLLHDKIGLK